MYFLTNWTLSMEGIHFGGYIKMVNAYILDQKQNISTISFSLNTDSKFKTLFDGLMN